MKKRPFILLEILIAILLLGTCMVFLISKPVELYRSQMAILEKVEKQRLADLAFAEVKVMLLNNDIPWKTLPTQKTKTIEYELSPAYIEIPHCQPKLIERRVVFKRLKDKQGLKGETYLLLEVEIRFGTDPTPKKRYQKLESKRYFYQTIIRKL